MICTMLRCVRAVSLDIWRVERSVCFWPFWLSRQCRLISSYPQLSRSLQYARALVCCPRACGRCFMFPEYLSVKCLVVPVFSLSSKILSLSSVNRLSQGLVFIAEWHVTLAVYRHCINKFLLFTITSSAFVYKHWKCI